MTILQHDLEQLSKEDTISSERAHELTLMGKLVWSHGGNNVVKLTNRLNKHYYLINGDTIGGIAYKHIVCDAYRATRILLSYGVSGYTIHTKLCICISIINEILTSMGRVPMVKIEKKIKEVIPEHPGATLEKELIKNNLTPKQFSELSNISITSISGILKRKKNLTSDMCKRLSDNTSIDYCDWVRTQFKYDIYIQQH